MAPCTSRGHATPWTATCPSLKKARHLWRRALATTATAGRTWAATWACAATAPARATARPACGGARCVVSHSARRTQPCRRLVVGVLFATTCPSLPSSISVPPPSPNTTPSGLLHRLRRVRHRDVRHRPHHGQRAAHRQARLPRTLLQQHHGAHPAAERVDHEHRRRGRQRAGQLPVRRCRVFCRAGWEKRGSIAPAQPVAAVSTSLVAFVL
jgi:hypothetical protein